MSYNITNFKIKKIENFRIPIKAFYIDRPRKDWNPKEPYYFDDIGGISIEDEFGHEIIGKHDSEKDEIIINSIILKGEGSGSYKDNVLDEVFKESKGFLEAIIIWEGGESFTHLIVREGVVVENEIEL